MNVSEAGVSSQADNWGALAISFEEIAARRGPTPEIALLEDCLAPPLRGSYSSAYVPASYDASEFFPRHTLPFLVNVVCNQSPDVSISWFGGRSESYELFFKYLKSSRPAADLRLVALEHNASAVAAALESSDVFIFDFSSFTTNRENEFVLKALFAVEACEQDRRSPHTQPRPVVGVNVIHNEFERWFVGAVEANYSPFSSRIRVGFIRPRETEISLTRLFAAGPGARQHGYGQPVADGTRNGWYMEASHLASIPGVYRLVFELRANGTVTGAQPFGFIEARCGPDLMSVRWMTAEDLEKQTVSLDFVLSEASLLEGPPVTIRIKAISSIEFSVLDIRARRLSPEEASEFPDYGLCLGKDLLPIMSIGDAGDWIDSRVVSKLERSGHIVFGPNWSISPGRYVAKFHIENLSQGSSAMRTVVLEAGCGPVFFGQRDLSSFEISGRPQELRFSVPEGSSPKSFELRVWTSGEVAVALSHISIHSNAAEIDLPT